MLALGIFRARRDGEAHTVKRTLVCDIINEKDSHGASVVCCRDGPEAFLARRVPNLQLHPLAIQFDRADFEVDADGGDEGWGEGVLTESQETAGFAHARVANQQEFDLRDR